MQNLKTLNFLQPGQPWDEVFENNILELENLKESVEELRFPLHKIEDLIEISKYKKINKLHLDISKFEDVQYQYLQNSIKLLKTLEINSFGINFTKTNQTDDGFDEINIRIY